MGKRVGCIDNQADFVLSAKASHRFSIQSSVYALPVMQGNVLLTRFGAVEVGRTCLFQHLRSLTSFCCSSENQYHDSIVLPCCLQRYSFFCIMHLNSPNSILLLSSFLPTLSTLCSKSRYCYYLFFVNLVEMWKINKNWKNP